MWYKQCSKCEKEFLEEETKEGCPKCKNNHFYDINYYTEEEALAGKMRRAAELQEKIDARLKFRPGFVFCSLVGLFAIAFGFVVSDGFRVVLQKMFMISREEMGIALWGDVIFGRMLASLLGSFAVGFIVGATLKKQERLFSIAATIPTSIFWMFALIFPSYFLYNFNLANPSHILLSVVLVLLTPVFAFWGCEHGKSNKQFFTIEDSILNIKWYHWLWIMPLYLNKVVAIILFTLVLLWRQDPIATAHPSIVEVFLQFLFNFGGVISYLVILFALGGLLYSVTYVYKALVSKSITMKEGVVVFCNVLLFQIIYILLFVT